MDDRQFSSITNMKRKTQLLLLSRFLEGSVRTVTRRELIMGT
jgi:hypothetical protein